MKLRIMSYTRQFIMGCVGDAKGTRAGGIRVARVGERVRTMNGWRALRLAAHRGGAKDGDIRVLRCIGRRM